MTYIIDRPLPHDRRVASLISAFRRRFRRPPEGIAEAPGRVNLIGEHVDYNDGLVLPFAVDRSVLCAWAPSVEHDGLVSVYSLDYDEEFPYYYLLFDPLRDEGDRPPRRWGDYPLGAMWALREACGLVAKNFDIAVAGDIPQGAGLSSSAAIEVAVAGSLRDAFDLPIDDMELARLCQRAENEYVGVQCGIMDQFASTLSQRDHALLLDCRSLAHEAVPLRLAAAGLTIVIANCAVRRELITSAYNDRRRECEEAVVDLRRRLDRPALVSLRDVSAADLERMTIDTVPVKRARHVVTEIARVAAAVDALKRDDFDTLGHLMVESHLSLRDDYEVSADELDLLVALATAQDYVLGARLTGAGFGGCTVNLVRTDSVDTFARDVVATYRERTGLPAVMYITAPQEGLHAWRL